MGAVCGAPRAEPPASKAEAPDQNLLEPPRARSRSTHEVLDDDASLSGSALGDYVGNGPSVKFVLVTLLLSCLPVGCFILLFSTLGYGVQVHAWVAVHPITVMRAGASTLSVFFLAWFFHLSRWFKWLAAPLSLVAFVGTTCMIISIQASAPSWPLGLLLASFPVCVIAGRAVAEGVSGAPLATYTVFSALWRALIGVALLVLAWWLSVYSTRVFHRGAIPRELSSISHRVGCVPCDISPEWGCVDTKGHRDDGGRACVLAYMLWVNPVIAAFGCALFATLAFALTDAKDGAVEKVTRQSLAVLVAFIWVAVEVAAVAYRFATIVTLWALCGVAGAFIASWVYSSMALHDLMQGRPLGRDAKTVELTIGNLRIAKRLNAKASTILLELGASYGDWALALLIISPAPLVAALYVLLDAVRHLALRRKEEPRGVSIIRSYVHYNWASVLPKAVTLCTVFYVVTVGAGKAMVLVLAWLTGTLKGLPLGAVIGAYMFAGAFLFLIPAVPATSIFITGGIVVTSAARWQYGYWGGIGIATLTCFALKLVAIVVQQEGVGRYLASSARVRKLVSVNSVNTRAIRRIITQRGLSFPKVSVLVGGPDWPTSVLAGILRCDVKQCLLGSLPVIVFLWPPVVMGALSLPKPPMDADQKKLVLIFASLMGLVPLLLAMRAIEREVSVHRAELEQEEPDLEVVQLEVAERRSSAVRTAAAHWDRQHVLDIVYQQGGEPQRLPLQPGWLQPMPAGVRVLLVVGWLCAWACVTLTAAFDDLCFVVFEITDSIQEKLGGNALNAIMPLGWVSFGLLLGALLCVRVFGRWASAETVKLDAKLKAQEEETQKAAAD